MEASWLGSVPARQCTHGRLSGWAFWEGTHNRGSRAGRTGKGREREGAEGSKWAHSRAAGAHGRVLNVEGVAAGAEHGLEILKCEGKKVDLQKEMCTYM